MLYVYIHYIYMFIHYIYVLICFIFLYTCFLSPRSKHPAPSPAPTFQYLASPDLLEVEVARVDPGNRTVEATYNPAKAHCGGRATAKEPRAVPGPWSGGRTGAGDRRPGARGRGPGARVRMPGTPQGPQRFPRDPLESPGTHKTRSWIPQVPLGVSRPTPLGPSWAPRGLFWPPRGLPWAPLGTLSNSMTPTTCFVTGAFPGLDPK